jgi:hypothetical protein
VTGRPLLWAAGLALVALVAFVIFVLTDDSRVITPDSTPAPSGEGVSSRAQGASELLSKLETALNQGSRRETVALAAPDEPTAAESLRDIYSNVRALGMEDLSFRFIDEDAAELSAAERRTLGRRAWVADVAVSWSIGGYDEGASKMEVSFTMVDTPDGVAFGSAGGDYGHAAPLWLLDDLAVDQSRRALVAATSRAEAERYAGWADQAVRDVKATLPGWRGKLVVEVPATQEQLHRLLGAAPDTYYSIAAVTATVDGSMSSSSPVHIFVNPVVFGRLGEDGSQIVMSHEATHVASDAATSTMPLWVLEGFADYVALARTDLPVSVTASQILAEVRKSGAPKALPGADDFNPANKLLGTSYEAAWLACRFLAQEYGEGALIDFYETVGEGTTLGEGFRELGTTERAFTRAWRDHLRELAG